MRGLKWRLSVAHINAPLAYRQLGSSACFKAEGNFCFPQDIQYKRLLVRIPTTANLWRLDSQTDQSTDFCWLCEVRFI